MGNVISEQKKMASNHRVSELFPALVFKDDLYYLEDGYVGIGFLCQPISGASEGVVAKLESIYSMDYPKDSFVQVMLMGMSDIEANLQAVKYLRTGRSAASRQDVIHAETNSKVDFLRKGSKQPLNPKAGLRVRNFDVLVTVKIPTQKKPVGKKELETIVSLRNALEEALEGIGMAPQLLTEEMYLRKMQTLFNWTDNASWRKEQTQSDRTRLLRDQIVDPGQFLKVKEDGISLPEKEVRLLSTHKWPMYTHLAKMMNLVGNWLTGSRGVRDNFCITLNVHVPDQNKARSSLDMKRQTVNYQAFGPMLKWVPKLADQKESHDSVYEKLKEGATVVRAYLQFMVFADNNDLAERAVSNIRTYYKECGFDVQQEYNFVLPLFLNALPFGQDPKAMIYMSRYMTMTSKHAVHLSPIMSDWKGTGTPILNLISRTSQQLMSFDFYDSPDNFNVTLSAKSGSGKSFLTNEIITSYLSSGSWEHGSLGGRVWVIDVGKSYVKLCEALKGQFICFDDNANFSLDPFRLIKDGMEGESAADGWADGYEISEEEEANPGGRDKYFYEQFDSILALLCAMASKDGSVDDFQMSVMSKALIESWNKERQELSITSYVEYLNSLIDSQEQIRTNPELKSAITKIVFQMYNFTEAGPYGKYFSKSFPPLEFTNDFVVLELEELKGKAHLQVCVLLQLLNQIQIEMYLSKGKQRKRRKSVILDEAWEFISGGDGNGTSAVGKWFETGYRRFRKYGGNGLIVTQSVNDLYGSDAGRAIAENSSIFLIMAQKPETIGLLRREGRLQMPDIGYELLESVHTSPKSGYSEIFWHSSMGSGIGRLMVSPFNMLLYSTHADDISEIQVHVDKGMEIGDAINQVLKDRGEA